MTNTDANSPCVIQIPDWVKSLSFDGPFTLLARAPAKDEMASSSRPATSGGIFIIYIKNFLFQPNLASFYVIYKYIYIYMIDVYIYI